MYNYTSIENGTEYKISLHGLCLYVCAGYGCEWSVRRVRKRWEKEEEKKKKGMEI